MEKKILLVADDEKMNRAVIARFFKDDFEVLQAENGRIALELIQSHKVDMVLLDIIMPEVNGLEVIQQIKANPEYDAIGILVATSTKEKTERQALGVGADDIVSKPYDPVVIRKKIENILKTKDLEKQCQSMGMQEKEEKWKQKWKLHFQNQIEERTQKIEKMVNVIGNNTENEEVVRRCVCDIKEELVQLKGMLKEESNPITGERR